MEILGIAIVDADTREAVAIRAVQTMLHQLRKGRRPNCVKKIEKDSLLTHYLLALHDHKKQLLKLSNIVVADAFFSKKTFVEGLSTMGFELVSRFRDDVRCAISTPVKKPVKGDTQSSMTESLIKTIYAKMSSKRRCTIGMDRK